MNNLLLLFNTPNGCIILIFAGHFYDFCACLMCGHCSNAVSHDLSVMIVRMGGELVGVWCMIDLFVVTFVYLAVSYDLMVMMVSSMVLLHSVFTLDVKKFSAPEIHAPNIHKSCNM